MADGQEFDITNATYRASNYGLPRVLGFKDGSYGIFWNIQGSEGGKNFSSFSPPHSLTPLFFLSVFAFTSSQLQK